MDDKYHRPNNIVVPITQPIPIVEDSVDNSYDNIIYDGQIEMNVHDTYSDIIYEEEEATTKSSFINYQVMIPISASTENIFTEDQVWTCSNSNEEKQKDVHENITINDKKTEADVDLSFLDEIDVDLIITYLKEVALIEKSENKETISEPSQKDNITKNKQNSIKRESKYVPPSKRKNKNTNLDKDNHTENKKYSTKKELVLPSKRKNLKANDTRSKTSYTKESVNKLLKHIRQHYEAEAKVNKVKSSNVSRHLDVENRRKTSMTSKTSRNERRTMEERNKLQQNIHQRTKHTIINKRTDILENLKLSEIRRNENNRDKKYNSAAQSSKSSKVIENKHQRIVKIRNKESDLPRSSSGNYANANLNPSSNMGKVLKAKERMKQYNKLKEQGFFNIKSHDQMKTLIKAKYEGLQDKSNIQRKYYLTNVESLKQTTGNVHENIKKHASQKTSVFDTKLIKSKFDNLANQKKLKTNTDIIINDSCKISGNELIELLNKLKTPKQESFNCSNQQVQSTPLDKHISNCVNTNGGKQEALNEGNNIKTHTISKQASQDDTSETLACSQTISTKSANKDGHNKTKYKIINSGHKQNSTVQQPIELRNKSQHIPTSLNVIYSNVKPGHTVKSDKLAHILVEKHNENVNSTKKQMPTSYDQMENKGGEQIPLTCDQNMNNISTKNQIEQTNVINHNHNENLNKIIKGKPKFDNNDTQTLVNQTNMKEKNVNVIETFEENTLPNKKAIFRTQKEKIGHLICKQKTNANLSIIEPNNHDIITEIDKEQNVTLKEHDTIKIEDDVMPNVCIKSTNKILEQNVALKEHDTIIIEDDVMLNVCIKSTNRILEQNVTLKGHDTIIIEDDVMPNVCIKSNNKILEQNVTLNEHDTIIIEDDVVPNVCIKSSNKILEQNTLLNENAKFRQQKDESVDLLHMKPKIENMKSLKQERTIIEHIKQEHKNIQSIANVNKIKEIQPKIEAQRKELNIKNKAIPFEQRSETSISNIKSLIEEDKNCNKTKCFAKQSIVKSNDDNKHGRNEQRIENSNANQKINVAKAESKQQCSKSENINSTDEKNRTSVSSEKLNTTTPIDNHKYLKTKNNNENLNNKLQIVNSSERLIGSLNSIQNDNIKSSNASTNKETKNDNEIKCLTNQSNVQPNNENEQGINKHTIENSNDYPQKTNIEKAEVKQECSTSGNTNSTDEKNGTLVSSEKIRTTTNQSNIKRNEILSNKQFHDNAKLHTANSSKKNSGSLTFQNDHIKSSIISLNEDVKYYNQTKSLGSQSNVKPNVEKKHEINEHSIENSNDNQQKTNVVKAVVEQECSKSGNSNSTDGKNGTLLSSDKINTTTTIENHKYVKNNNDANVYNINERNTVLEKQNMEPKPHDNHTDQIHNKELSTVARNNIKFLNMKFGKKLNNTVETLVKQPNAKTNNVTQSANKIIKQNIHDKGTTNVIKTSNSINAKSNIETSTKSNNQEKANEINIKKTDSKKPNEVQTSKTVISKTDSIKNIPYDPLKQNIVAAYFRIANKLYKNYNAYNNINQNAMELNISVHMGIYCKVSIIHDGWWSRIHKLHNNNTTDYMVLKQMRAQYSGYHNKGSEKERLLKDLQASCTLQEKSNFLRVFDGFQLNGTWCHVMEYYPFNLTEGLWSDRHGGFNICQIINLSQQLTGAVKTLKKYRIIHSEIQPNHILMNSSLTSLKLCGFDNAHYEEDTKYYKHINVVKSYCAPEVILKSSYGYSIDIWATACILFEITTKRPLFKCNLDTFAQQMSLLFNWDQKCDTDFDKLCKLQIKQSDNYMFQGSQSPMSQRSVTSYMIEGYRQVHPYKIPHKDEFRLQTFGKIVTKMLVLNPHKRLTMSSVFFKILAIV